MTQIENLKFKNKSYEGVAYNTNRKWLSGSDAYIHTYIIGHYIPSVRIIDLVSHITYVVCMLFLYISGRTYSLKSTPNDRFQFYLLLLFFPEIC